MVTAGVHRFLKTQGRNGQDLWRRSGFPIMVARHPTERPEVYGRCLTALMAELQRLQLPHVSQIGTDWAPGLGRVVRASMPRCVWVPDIDHMFKNMAKTNLVEESGEMVRVPRLKSRDIRVVHKYMDMLAMLPTTSLFLVTLRVFLDRIKNGWQEVEFHDFFVKQYLYKARVQEATFGVEEVLAARWYYGNQSHVAQGHPPAMQTPEQCHRQFKRCLTDSPERSLLQVLDSLKESVDLWSSSRTRQEADYTLFTCAGHCASRPCRPDEWMLTGSQLYQRRCPGAGVQLLPTIARIQEALRARRAGSS